jgi:hypothetical protein
MSLTTLIANGMPQRARCVVHIVTDRLRLARVLRRMPSMGVTKRDAEVLLALLILAVVFFIR